MKYHELLAYLDKELSGRFRVAIRPDHPLILGGPDLLAGGRGSLCAIFVQKHGEQERPNDLLTRLANTRLALPSHTVCYVMKSPTVALEPQMPSFADNFDGVFEFGDVSGVFNALTQSSPKARPDLTKIRKVAFQRATVLFKSALQVEKEAKLSSSRLNVLNEFRDKANAKPLSVPSWRTMQTRHSQKFIEGKGVVATLANFADKPPVRSVLQHIFDIGLRIDYSLDNGIPYPHFRTVNTILVDEIPHIPNDPLKPMRCASFLGWIMIPAESFGEYERLFKHLKKRLHLPLEEQQQT